MHVPPAERVAHAKHRDVIVVVPPAMNEQPRRFVRDDDVLVHEEQSYLFDFAQLRTSIDRRDGMSISRILVAVSLAACGGAVSSPAPEPSINDAAVEASIDVSSDHATTIACVFSDDAGSPFTVACGDWVSVDTIDFEVVDGGKKFNHETPCSSGVCVGTSCGVPDDAGVITTLGACETF
jgi:hypothetical protein